jgi:hypothetical protein
MNKRIRISGYVGMAAMLIGTSACRSSKSVRENTPVPYSAGEQIFVDKALDAYTAHSTMSREQALREVYPVSVALPDAVCIGLHPRPGWADGDATMCYDTNSGDLLTNYQPDTLMKYQHVPAKLAPPHYGNVP